MPDRATTVIPRYYLYGDQGADVEKDFLHIEPIRDRSGPHDWTIRPHAHPDHFQILLLTAGGGMIRVEERSLDLVPPAVIVLPPGVVHEIRFEEGTDGHVITAAHSFVQASAVSDRRLFDAALRAAVYPVEGTGVDLAACKDTFRWMHREYIWSAPGRHAAIQALFARALVMVLRLSVAHDAAWAGAPGHDLLARYRALLEMHFRSERSLIFYAEALAVTPARLNAACRARSGRTASALLYERLIIEAKRYLVYTESTVAQVGHMIGFDDPAYFNRFFSQRVGLSPGAFRLAQAERMT
ncbi:MULTISPECIES: helix-turn-helix domain-containing protein [unclassified Haematobacter]|uniref:helix-turn-helix domain-containing protein n=1 Tax=unclassified Haematobacter TaxID=2640585 RepID=UPI0025BCD2B0|nr:MULTISPECIES: helix-turn-helix domain-containing protein [unclassified Haematobacter]